MKHINNTTADQTIADYQVDSAHGYTLLEYTTVLATCRLLPPAVGNYLIDDYIDNLLLTVIDFMTRTVTVERAMGHFKTYVRVNVRTHADLKDLLTQYPDTRDGNTNLALCLWGYRMWTRAEMLRRLLEFFEANGVTNQADLSAWAENADFKNSFKGKIKGLSYAVFQWLVMRQGVNTIKPDVHVNRFVVSAIGRPVPEHVAVSMLVMAARDLGMKAYELDWRIWEQGRKPV